MNTVLKKTFRIATGILFLVLGIAGLFLPILQGILFIIVGLVLLAPYNPFIRRQLDAIHARYPRMYDRAHACKESMKRKFRRSCADRSRHDHADHCT